jgi:ABC-2 type transport system ATP-binding protein
MTGSESTAPTLEVRGLTKRFGAVLAVDDLTFSVGPGRVTGFLGPNGAGKTTTLRCLLGLVAPTGGAATIRGVAYSHLASPMRTVGASLEPGFHPGRTARAHLRVVCLEAGLPRARADEALALVGLEDAADRRLLGFSMGMRQRLSLAETLLGEPDVLVLDEPANGLDPEGIAWLRAVLRHHAAQGRTVLISSHVLSEVEQTVDDVIIIDRGRLVRACPLAELAAEAAVVVESPEAGRLAEALREAGLAATPTGPETLTVPRSEPAEVGRLAFAAGIELLGLRREGDVLEKVFLRLTGADEGGPA